MNDGQNYEAEKSPISEGLLLGNVNHLLTGSGAEKKGGSSIKKSGHAAKGKKEDQGRTE